MGWTAPRRRTGEAEALDVAASPLLTPRPDVEWCRLLFDPAFRKSQQGGRSAHSASVPPLLTHRTLFPRSLGYCQHHRHRHPRQDEAEAPRQARNLLQGAARPVPGDAGPVPRRRRRRPLHHLRRRRHHVPPRGAGVAGAAALGRHTRPLSQSPPPDQGEGATVLLPHRDCAGQTTTFVPLLRVSPLAGADSCTVQCPVQRGQAGARPC